MKMAAVVFLLACGLLACDLNLKENNAPPPESVQLPMKLSYSGTPEIGSMTNVQTVMEWNKRFSLLNMDVGDLLADTVTFHLSDGMEMTATRDSAIAFVRAYVSDISKIDISYTAAIPVNVVERGDEWVFSWTEESYTLKNGGVEHAFYHEDYRLLNGKIREVFQYARKLAPPALATN